MAESYILWLWHDMGSSGLSVPFPCHKPISPRRSIVHGGNAGYLHIMIIRFALVILFLASPACTLAPLNLPIQQRGWQALGTEPFWSIWVDGNSISYSTPEILKTVPVTVSRSAIAQGEIITGELNKQPLRLEIRHKPCSDGMSDRRYDWEALLRLGTETHTGCAIVRGG